MVDKNFDEIAAQNMENREFGANQSRPQIEDQEIKPTSLGKARMYETQGTGEPALLPGYHEIYTDNFPSKGLFYPEGTRLMIRAASVKEIRHFSTIDDKNPFSVDEALNEILSGCLQMRIPGKQSSFKDLREEDRIFVIMAIRELTFSKGENRLILNVSCRECDHENEIEVRNDAFESTELSETIMRYYNPELRRFDVQTKSSGTIIITPPSIGIMKEITKYIQKTQQEGKKLDQSFIKTLPYMIQDWRGFNETMIKNLEVEFMQWDSTKYQTMNKLIEMVRVGVKEELKRACSKCGSEVTTPISFPGGVKNLFVISDIAGELI